MNVKSITKTLSIMALPGFLAANGLASLAAPIQPLSDTASKGQLTQPKPTTPLEAGVAKALVIECEKQASTNTTGGTFTGCGSSQESALNNALAEAIDGKDWAKCKQDPACNTPCTLESNYCSNDFSVSYGTCNNGAQNILATVTFGSGCLVQMYCTECL